MKTYIVLLRGINVGGQKKVLMAELRQLLKNSGFQNVQTYIQSGNVILQSLEDREEVIEAIIKKAISGHFGFEVSVIAKTPEQLQHIFDDCPFSDEKTEQSLFIILHQIPDPNLIQELNKIDYPNEEFIITDHCVYFYCSTGYGRTKCSTNFFERKLKITATARNYKTMMKLLSLSSELS